MIGATVRRLFIAAYADVEHGLTTPAPHTFEIVARPPALIALQPGGVAIPAGAILETVTYDDEGTLATPGIIGCGRCKQIRFSRLVILTHGFERPEKIAAR